MAPRALLPGGWRSDVLVEIDADGSISRLQADAMPSSEIDVVKVRGPLLPGMSNCHSHAWQRVLVGRTEKCLPGKDDFWGWREAMYRSLERIGPAELRAITAQVYVEMLKAGYTSVGEFHYLHHSAEGRAFENVAEMSLQILAAAQATGLRTTLLPVLYCFGDFGGKPATEGQARFLNSKDSYLRLLEILARAVQHSDALRLGVAPHSLRATDEFLMRETLEVVDELLPGVPIHIHIAEQLREVEVCMAATGQRPVQWLMDRFDVNKRWCLVHATHLTDEETRRLARSDAIAGLCPTTEANLGDGIFPAVEYLKLGGRFGLGSDSQMSIDPVAECRLLEYGQRLIHRKRSLLASETLPNCGEYLYLTACQGGAQSLGIDAGKIEVGQQADFLVLDETDSVLSGQGNDSLIDSWIFGSQKPAVKDVMVGGVWRVRNFRHASEESIKSDFLNVLARVSA